MYPGAGIVTSHHLLKQGQRSSTDVALKYLPQISTELPWVEKAEEDLVWDAKNSASTHRCQI